MVVKRQGGPVLWVLTALLTGQVILMSLEARHPETGHSFFRAWTMTAASPLLSAVGSVVSDVSSVWHNYAALRHAQQENETLRQQLAQVQLEFHHLNEANKRAERVQQIVEYQKTLPTRSVMARVIGRDASGWFQTVIINQGRQAGIKLNAAVVTPGGLVGRVTQLGRSAAQVRLITDERSGAGAVVGVLAESRSLGVVEGKNEALCKMRYVPGSEPVEVGELVFTTGQDGIFPKGIPIGRVASVEKGSAMVSHDITVEPLAQLGKLEEVIVLLDQPDKIELDSSVASAASPRASDR